MNGNNGCKVKNPSRSSTPTPNAFARSKTANQPHSYNKTNNYYDRAGKRTPKYYHSKSSKRRESDHYQKDKREQEQRKPKPIKIRDSKPWKHLPDVKTEKTPQVCAQNQQKTVTTVSDPLIPEDILTSILGDVPVISAEVDNKPDMAKLSSLWDTGDISAAAPCKPNNLWEFTDCLSTRPKMIPVLNDDNLYQANERSLTSDATSEAPSVTEFDHVQHSKAWNSDYNLIEQSLASFKFCEDVGDELEGSRLAPLLRENPFCYMVKHGTPSTFDTDAGVHMNPFTCRHCEETYEIVLESEAETPTPYTSKLFDHIDSRLDFDWTKYHPPPWSSTAEDASERRSVVEFNFACDCEFCRSRIWRKSCKWCGTPL